MKLWGFVGAISLFCGAAWAGQPVNGGLGFQPPGSDMMRQVDSFHNVLLVMCFSISLFVLALLAIIVLRYRKSANPVAQKFTHNWTLEIAWTVIPVLILVAISFLSFPVLFAQETSQKADLTIKATGNTWNWSYSYPDYGVDIASSNLLEKSDAEAQNRPYMLATDTPIYVPIGKTVKMLVTSNDVIHSWAMPAFAFKQDAVPGRVNEGWFKPEKIGVYYGQCSELCGTRHAFMPIEVRVVSEEEFGRWVVEQGGQITTAGTVTAPGQDG